MFKKIPNLMLTLCLIKAMPLACFCNLKIKSMLQLTRPIAFFDLETTGLDKVRDRIVELAVLKIMPDGSQKRMNQRINPEMPIPKQSTEIHKITDEDVKDMPTFKSIAHELRNFLSDCDFGGYNSNYFDIPVLAEEFARVKVDFSIEGRKFVDVQAVFHKQEPRDLKAAYKFYCGKDLMKAHSAEADITATYEILLAQLERYEDLKNDVNFLHNYTVRNNKQVDLAGLIVRNDANVEVFNFGRYKTQPVAEVFKKDGGYYNWMMQGDFAEYTKKVVTEIRLRSMNDK